MCDAVEGLFLDELALPALRAAAVASRRRGVDVLFLTDGPLGDAIVLAAALGAWTTRVLLGVRVSLGTRPHRHPTVLAREMTTFDIVVGGRARCWPSRRRSPRPSPRRSPCAGRCGARAIAAGEGPRYPVAGAINRPAPREAGRPADRAGPDRRVSVPRPALLDLCDLVLRSRRPHRCPAGLPRAIGRVPRSWTTRAERGAPSLAQPCMAMWSVRTRTFIRTSPSLRIG